MTVIENYINEVLLGSQPCQFVKNQHFRDHFCPHHQDSDVTMHADSPTHIPPKRTCLILGMFQWGASGWSEVLLACSYFWVGVFLNCFTMFITRYQD
jgi:hypothetical protein